MMKIVYTIAGTYRAAGMERVLADKTAWLCSHGYEVVVVTTEQKGRESAFRMDPSIRMVDLGIGYEDNNGGSFLSKLVHYPIKQYRHKKALSVLLEKEKADVVVSMFCNDESFLPKIKDGSKKVLEVHFSRFKRMLYGRKGIWALADKYRSFRDLKHIARFDRFVVLTDEDKTYWGSLPNIEVIKNSIEGRAEHPSKLDSKTVIAVGRLSYQKSIDRLVDAWRSGCAHWGFPVQWNSRGCSKIWMQYMTMRPFLLFPPGMKDFLWCFLRRRLMAFRLFLSHANAAPKTSSTMARTACLLKKVISKAWLMPYAHLLIPLKNSKLWGKLLMKTPSAGTGRT